MFRHAQIERNVTTRQPLVTTRLGRATTNSRDVATLFGKRHSDVLRAISNLDCSAQFNERNFALVEYRDAKGEARRSFNMTKDGFVFLVMGFTGKQAAQFKEAYIQRFNEMEAELRRSHRTGDLGSVTVHHPPYKGKGVPPNCPRCHSLHEAWTELCSSMADLLNEALRDLDSAPDRLD